mmetsp:Transcript_55024/g.76278  ORF Transcript_55024/g.76278 Transcript_55024/m.76278 type:complete len:213 (-) Transcript_55024:364-1002(-)
MLGAELLAELPELLCQFFVGCSLARLHSAALVVVASSLALQLGRECASDGGRTRLLKGTSENGGNAHGGPDKHATVTKVAACHGGRVQRVRPDILAIGHETTVQFVGKQNVAELALGIGLLVGNVAEGLLLQWEVVEVNHSRIVGVRGHHHDTCQRISSARLLQLGKEQRSKQEVSKVVDAKVPLVSLLCLAILGCKDASIEHEPVEGQAKL